MLSSFPGQVRAHVKCEAHLVPADLARLHPAGKARDEPNENPFLDPDDPHLLLGRDWKNNALFDAAASLAEGAIFLAKVILALKILGAIVGGIGFVIITLSSAGVIGGGE